MSLRKHGFANESRMARWFGEDMLRQLQSASAELHTPTPIAYTPSGDVIYAVDGYFIGRIAGGGFTSLSDLIAEATGGKRQDQLFNKVGTTGAVGFANSLWRVGNVPAAAAAAAALAGGTHNTNDTAGGLLQKDPTGGDTLHVTTITAAASVGGQLLLLYDRLWNGLIALSSSAVQTCTLTGYPNSTGRYSSAADSVGNFAFVCNEGGATLSAVAHNWTMVYTDDAGNTGNSTGAIAGISGAIVNRVDHAGFSLPLLNGDRGIQDIESIQCSVATVAAGAPTIVLAHPLVLIPQLAANIPFIVDGINSAFNLVEVKTDACLAFLELSKSATTATTYTGQVTEVSG